MEDTELEEGEACYYKGDTSIDPFIALSYIDEKVQSVLGHFQKDFEGGVSAENLGAKFGGYGSFLPTHQRSPSIWSQPKTPQSDQNCSLPRSPNVLPVEGAPPNSTAPSVAALSLRFDTASPSFNRLHNERGPSGDVSAKQDSCLSSALVIEQFPLKHEPVSNKLVNPTDHRALKVRIKVASDSIARKNAAIYSGLGLISPSSSLGNSPEESEGTPSDCHETLDESPHIILQIMTSFPVPGGLLMSPLHESLICLVRKETLSQNNKPVPAIKSGQECSSALVDDSSSLVGDRKVQKEKKTKIVEKNDNLVVLKRDIGISLDDNKTTLVKREVVSESRNMENETVGQKECFCNDTELTLSNSVSNFVHTVKGMAMAPGVPRDTARNIPMKKREVIKDEMEEKEESLEMIADQDDSKYEKAEARSSSMKKISECRLRNSHGDVSTDIREDGQSKGSKVSAPFKADTDVSKCKRDPNIGAMDHSKQKVGQTATYHEQDKIKIAHGVGMFSFEGKKKSKGSRSNGKLASEVEESQMAEVYEAPKEKKAGKIHNSKAVKHIRKIRDSYKDVLPETRVEAMNNQMDSLEKPFGDRAKDSNHEVVEKEQCAFLNKSKEISTCKMVDTQVTSETLLKEAANDDRPSAKDGVTSEMELTSVAPVVIEEHWVCCDRCQKWRLLPYGTKPEQLPEKWLCSMLNWLPGKNRCDISEEETTKALHALYQLPLSVNQHNLQNHVDRTAAGAASADAWHFDRDHQNLGSHGKPNPQKEKQGSKETPYAASNGGPIQIAGSKNFQQELVKSRSLNDMNQPNLESNLMNNSIVQHLSKSRNFPTEKSTHKQKEKHVNSGDAKQKKMKSMRIEEDVAVCTDKYWITENSGNLDKIGCRFPTKAAFKSMEKHEHYYSKDAKSGRKEKLQISAKKQGERGSVSLHTGSLDMKTCDDIEISLKKRKLKDWQESQNHVVTSQNNGNHVPKGKVFVKEEPSDNEFRKAKKSRVSRTEGKESSTRKGDDKLNRKVKVTRILLSGSRENPVHGREEVRIIEKDQRPRKHEIKVVSKPASDDIDPFKRDLGFEQFSMAATSSSSKVSDSCKNRAHFPEVKGSPVESVSSSPMRTSNLDKLSPTRRDISRKDALRNGDFPAVDSPRIVNGQGNVESNRSGTAREGKISGVSHSGSLGFPVLDFRDNNASQKFGGKSKSSDKPPSEFQISQLVSTGANNLESLRPGDLHSLDHCHNEDRMNKNHYHDNALVPQKSGKGSSLLSQDKDRSSGNKFERAKLKESDPPSEMEVLNLKKSLRDEIETGPCNVASLHEESSDSKCRIKLIRDEKGVGSVDSGKWASDSGRENQREFLEHDGSAMKLGGLCHKNGMFIPQQNLIQDFGSEFAKKSDPTQVESRGVDSQVFPRNVEDPLAHVPQPVPALRKGSVFDVIPLDSSGDSSKVLKQPTNAVNHLGYPVPNQRSFKDAPIPPRRDASSYLASNALKEAQVLKDTADRLKDSGFGFECNEAYFQAALKFLHGASLLETCNGDSSKHGEMSQMQIYSSTAKLCEICAHEYEKRQEMSAAALAYKCMQVAYMRIVCCKNSSMSRGRHDLQASLQVIPQGESPSSSASDIDNLNNQAMVDKAALSKGIGSHAGNHVIVARYRPSFVRLLDFTKDVNSAMEASRKSQNAFAAANVILEEAQNNEGIVSLKRVIDFSFQDVEELIRLVRLAIEAISRQGFSGSKD